MVPKAYHLHFMIDSFFLPISSSSSCCCCYCDRSAAAAAAAADVDTRAAAARPRVSSDSICMSLFISFS